jgi:hypothetical protein
MTLLERAAISSQTPEVVGVLWDGITICCPWHMTVDFLQVRRRLRQKKQLHRECNFASQAAEPS